MEAVRARVSFTCPGLLKQSSPARNPRFGWLCCGDGSIGINPFRPLPDFLEAALTGTDPRCRAIQKNLRRYNNAFAFTSVKSNITNHCITGAGPMGFQIQGGLYHLAGPIVVATEDRPAFAQVYFHDPAEATNIRLGHFPEADQRFLQELGQLIHSKNNLVRSPFCVTKRGTVTRLL